MSQTVDFELTPADNERLVNLCGVLDANIHHIARTYSVHIHRRGEQFQLHGDCAPIAADVIKKLYLQADKNIDVNEVRRFLAEQMFASDDDSDSDSGSGNGGDKELLRSEPQAKADKTTALADKTAALKVFNEQQQIYLDKILNHTITFSVGPAGTGKTYVALMAAVSLLRQKSRQYRRLVLTRPIVEAGSERLGFLPGDMDQKINPYLRSLHDVLWQLMSKSELERIMAAGRIEFIPLAYMRGLTLNNCLVVLDEAQNTTPTQMKMLLTRIGEGSKFMINGDTEQSDVTNQQQSGLVDAINRLSAIDGIAEHRFTHADVVRHPLIKKILQAYEK